MTVLEDEVIFVRNKLSLSKPTKDLRNINNTEHPVKRKNPLDFDTNPTKKLVIENMLNGYRSNDNHYRSSGDTAQECPVATLSNMGNTCFLNSVLYTLRFAPTFLHNLHHLIVDLALVNSRLNQNKAKSSSLGRTVGTISGPSSRSTSSKDLLSLGNCDIIPKSKVQIVTEKLHELFITMHNLELKDSSDAYQPSTFLQAVRDANFIFEGNHQQDAHELLVYLLDNLRETCEFLTQLVENQPELLNDPETSHSSNTSKLWNVRRSWKITNKKKDKAPKDLINEEPVNNTDDDGASVDSNPENSKKKVGYNFVIEDFEGITLRRTTCLECENFSEKKEPFFDIPVPITYNENDFETNPNEIYRKACLTIEKLCDSNKYLCENCQRYNEAKREVLFEKLPNILVLQLKRFTTTAAGVQKVNSYLPTPLKLECFCVSCNESESLHRYQLCCVIMHLGGTLASGHYIAYVKVTDHFEDYSDCSRDLPRGTLSASSSEKSINILKYLKPRAFTSAFIENKNGIVSSKSGGGIGICKSIDCCGIKLNKNVVENVVNSYAKRWQLPSPETQEDVWLECDDENVRPLSNKEFQELLSYKPKSTSTPYLLFYSKINDSIASE
ncbi:hypothetical protein ILUMI_07177 [Ignelater luminosus]|uniref:USP domain-containing protein n=1 Tax=Ignelater luminosus TaxID=2038154 RepID=A0A8K0D9A0_IGNLU|nr:hypothetical protein ILUMI_07177 [Ignelater luminosus]